jgi:hypothetical protein
MCSILENHWLLNVDRPGAKFSSKNHEKPALAILLLAPTLADAAKLDHLENGCRVLSFMNLRPRSITHTSVAGWTES